MAQLYSLHLLLATAALFLASSIALDDPLLYELLEEQRPGTFIANIKNDARLGQKYSDDQLRQLQFNFLTPAVESDMFVLGEYSGILETAEVIDRDRLCPGKEDCVVDLQIAVQPNTFFEVIKVSLEILDENDNAPKFPATHISRSVPETTQPGDLFPIVAATDLDSPANGVIQYDLISSSDIFRLDNRLQGLTLALTDYLNREDKEFFQLKVVASDGGSPAKTGTVTIDITVDDVNDNNPEFQQSSYNLELTENIAPFTTVVKVKADDPDAGANGIIVYSFDAKTLATFGELFDINNVNGEIFTKKVLDYETHPSVTLVVVAQDQGKGSVPAIAKVNIIVIDVNDNAPKIELTVDKLSEEGSVLVDENTPVDTFVALVAVQDPDGGEEGKVECSLNDEYFFLERMYESDYMIKTGAELDREEHDRYNVVLTCHDMGADRKTSTVNMTIEIVDENDNKPTFEHVLYNVSMNENNEPGDVVVQVIAHDHDVGKNGDIVYVLHKDAGNAFEIDPKSGLIKARISFDREHVEYMEFHVVATDQGNEALYSDAMVALTILDLNDEPPEFTQSKYIFTVSENLPGKTEVGKVVAIDRDIGGNNAFSYYLEAASSDTAEFSIDPITGSILTKKILNREQKEVYTLKVLVQSESLPHMSDTAEVTVYVSDQNDNAPYIVFPPNDEDNTIHITNDVPVGTVVANVTATDADFGANKELTFMISEGDENGEFVIDPQSGKILVDSDLSGYDSAVFRLIIMVKDNGAPKKISVATVNIIVNKGAGVVGGMTGNDGKGLKLSNTHLAIIIGVIAGCLLIATILIIAIICVRRRNKNLRHDEMYWPKGAPGDLQNHSDDQKSAGTTPNHKPAPVTTHGFPSPEVNQSKKLPDYADVGIGLKAEYLNIHQGNLHPANKDKDTDSGCADVSHSESQGSNEDGDSSQRSSKNSDNGVTTVPVVVKTYNPNHKRTQPRRMESFSDWVHQENYHLQQKGNMYRVQDPSPTANSTGTASRKSVRFTEPTANQNDYTPDPVSSFAKGGQQSGELGATVNVVDCNYPPTVDPYDNAGSLV